ncbi:hypothetical protein L228DRAFT_62452 [Xylona heveae TC161]|uniref:Uncharacterized protein n=1 Tax=Xylona heveae (strain CBS 132557 / TC161) TaxID=1328760 RepID=A0A165IMU9_XYLHT|nr:hypothetical protein L228DRAFT_62452 [Xylona heveae TC161]KZF25124.1 hypothetical protein L228DRAFT_62452 [Xylona heveae TC161]
MDLCMASSKAITTPSLDVISCTVCVLHLSSAGGRQCSSSTAPRCLACILCSLALTQVTRRLLSYGWKDAAFLSEPFTSKTSSLLKHLEVFSMSRILQSDPAYPSRAGPLSSH